MMKEKQLRSTLGRHLSVGSLVVVIDHNLPGLKRARHKFTCLFLYIFPPKGMLFIGKGKKTPYQLYQKGQGCRVHPQSLQLLHSCQKPVTEGWNACQVKCGINFTNINITVTYRRYIFRRELVGGVWNQQAGFSHCSITHNNTFDSLHLCALIVLCCERYRDNVTSLSMH